MHAFYRFVILLRDVFSLLTSRRLYRFRWQFGAVVATLKQHVFSE
jgi:hypothetical protein